MGFWEWVLYGVPTYAIVGFIVSVLAVRIEWRDMNRNKGHIVSYGRIAGSAFMYAAFWPIAVVSYVVYKLCTVLAPVMRTLYTPAEVRKTPPAKRVEKNVAARW